MLKPINVSNYGFGWVNVKFGWGYPICPERVPGTPWWSMSILQMNSYTLGCYDAGILKVPPNNDQTADDSVYECNWGGGGGSPVVEMSIADRTAMDEQLHHARSQLQASMPSIEDADLRLRASEMIDLPIEEWRTEGMAHRFKAICEDLMKYRLGMARQALGAINEPSAT